MSESLLQAWARSTPSAAACRSSGTTSSRESPGIRRISSFPINNYSVQIAGEVDLPDLAPYFKNKKMTRRLDRFVILAHIAGAQAMRDSGLDVEKTPHRYGAIIGTGEGGAATRYINTKKIVEDGMQAASPFFAMCIPSTASGFFAMEWNLQGPCFSVNSACATGNHALGCRPRSSGWAWRTPSLPGGPRP